MPGGAWALLGELLWLSLGRELSLGQLSPCWGREGGRGSLPPPTLHPPPWASIPPSLSWFPSVTIEAEDVPLLPAPG